MLRMYDENQVFFNNFKFADSVNVKKFLNLWFDGGILYTFLKN